MILKIQNVILKVRKSLLLYNSLSLYQILKLRILKICNGKGRLIVYKKSTFVIDKKARIILENGMFQFNKNWTKRDPFPSLLSMGINAKLTVKNSFRIYSGSRIYINNNAELILGNGYSNNNLYLSCYDKIEIGNDVAISLNVCIRDSDNHSILGGQHIQTKPIKIGNHVWIGMNVTILKGVTIGDGAVIAAGSLVNKNIPAECLAGGVPARVLKKDVKWEI